MPTLNCFGQWHCKGSHEPKCVTDSVHHTNGPHWQGLLPAPSHNNPIQVCRQPYIWLPKETILIFLDIQTRRMQGRLRSSFNPMEAATSSQTERSPQNCIEKRKKQQVHSPSMPRFWWDVGFTSPIFCPWELLNAHVSLISGPVHSG